MISSRLACGFLAALLSLATPAQSGELPRPEGLVVLTISGAIGKTNRGAVDTDEDSFFKYHEVSFERAAAFDLAMLEALGLREVVTDYPGWSQPSRFEGPWLRDLLDAVDAEVKTLTAVALDSYASEISQEDLATYDWLVAVKRDGKYLGIGEQGPLWIVYARRDGKPLTHDDEARWPWAVFFIRVE